MKTVRVHFSSPHFVLSKQSHELIITLTPPIIPYLEFDRCNTDDDRDADLSELPLPIRILVLLLLRGRFCPAGDTADDIFFSPEAGCNSFTVSFKVYFAFDNASNDIVVQESITECSYPFKMFLKLYV